MTQAVEALSVGQLFRKSRNALAREFRGPVWVHGEIKALREQRGSLYLSLVEPGDYSDGGDINVDVAAWPKRNALLQAQLRQSGVRLAAGMVVNVEGNVTLSKVGRLQVELLRLDTDALVGRQEAEKRRVVEVLTAEGVVDANRRLAVPAVPLRIGLVSSDGSEGFNDFLGQLQRSPFAFNVTFRHSAVQGPAAPNSLARAITELAAESLDMIAVVRGGGGELDAFDKEPVVRAVATAAVPVWTGIGHTGDRSLTDEVANRSFITPTECGQGIVTAVATYVSEISDLAGRISRYSERALDAQAGRLRGTSKHLVSVVEHGMTRAQGQLHRQGERARRCADRDLALSAQTVEGYRKDLTRGVALVTHESTATVVGLAARTRASALALLTNIDRDAKLYRSQVSGFDPVAQLRRGYSLTRLANGKLVRNVADLKVGATITTQLAGGVAQSTVVGAEPTQEN